MRPGKMVPGLPAASGSGTQSYSILMGFGLDLTGFVKRLGFRICRYADLRRIDDLSVSSL